MTFADGTFAVFTVVNSVRFLAYVPQIAKALKDRSGAEAISLGTWTLFLASHVSGMAYAVVNQGDWTMAWLFLSNAVGCIAVLAIAAFKRTHHRRTSAMTIQDQRPELRGDLADRRLEAREASQSGPGKPGHFSLIGESWT